MASKNFYLLLVLSLGVLGSCRQPVVQLDPSAKLKEIQVSCEQNQAPKSVYLPCEAVGVYSDGSSRRLTYEATWSTSDSSILESSSATHPSWVRGVAPGGGEVIASIGSIEGSFPINVTSAVPISLMVAPANQIYNAGIQQQFTSICIFSDSTSMDVTRSSTWSSQNISIASVAATVSESGLVSAKTTGVTSISASFGGIQGSAPITVINKVLLAIQIGPNPITLIRGLSTSLTVTGIYTDLSMANLNSVATWSSGDDSVATVSNASGTKGQLTGVSAGFAQIQVHYGGFSDQAIVGITTPTLGSIQITPATPTFAKGLSQQLIATGYYTDGSTIDVSENLTWSSSNTSIGTVSNVAGQKGRITGVGVGSATISGTYSGVTASITMTVSPAILSSISLAPSSPSVSLGLTQAMTATGVYTDGTTVDLTASADWVSASPSIATIGNTAGVKGIITALALGTSVVTVSFSGVSAQITITAASPLLASIAVTPINAVIAKGLTQQYVATGTYSDGSTADITSAVTWTSLNAAVASISNVGGSRGLATGAGVGNTHIVATMALITGQAPIQVTAPLLLSITVTPANSTIMLLSQVQFVATGFYTDGTSVDITESVTWHSSNTLTATISNTPGTKGAASGVGLSSTTITATDVGGVFGSTQLNGIL